MKDSLFTILLIFLSVDALALFLLLIYRLQRALRRRKIRHYGDQAEEKVSQYIEEEIPGAVLFNNIFLKTDRGITQIDHILLCKWGVFVIETKSHNGKINIAKKEWVQIYGDKVVRFHSPLLQNEIHCKALRQILRKNRSFSRVPVNGIVVFTSKKLYFSQRPEGVVRLDELGTYIKSGGKTVNKRALLLAKPGAFYLSRQKILSLEKWIRRNCVRSRRRKRIHEKTVRNLDRNDF